MAKKIQIKLKPDGTIEMETKGIKGKACLNYIDLLAKLTDSRIDNYEYTQEYYENEVNENTVNNCENG